MFLVKKNQIVGLALGYAFPDPAISICSYFFFPKCSRHDSNSHGFFFFYWSLCVFNQFVVCVVLVLDSLQFSSVRLVHHERFGIIESRLRFWETNQVIPWNGIVEEDTMSRKFPVLLLWVIEIFLYDCSIRFRKLS